MGYGKKFTEEQLQKLLDSGRVKIAGSSPKHERGARNEPVAKKEAPRFDGSYGFNGPVRVSYIERRKRLLDSDGGCDKFTTDALVDGGILKDDTTKEIPERPSHRQEKAEEESLTIIVKLI